MQKLKSQGVEGRIWGCSSVLSQCKNFTELCPQYLIPDIEIVDKIKTGIYETEIGTRKIITITFDINQTPNLNSLLHRHLYSQINQHEKFKLQPT